MQVLTESHLAFLIENDDEPDKTAKQGWFPEGNSIS